MSLLDDIKQKAKGVFGGEAQAMQSMSMLTQLFNQSGGVTGFMEKFKTAGLADTLKSWMSDGKKLPISGDQVQQVFGSDQMSSLAKKAGLDVDQVSSQLANHLPHFVEKLSSNGQLLSMDQISSKLSDVKSFLH